MAKAKGPTDPATSAPVALSGRIVTMDQNAKVWPSAVLYARDGAIVDILPTDAPPPAGFETVSVTSTRGTLYPGLIELHNHLPYDVLGLWPVPKKYTNRDQWSSPSTPQYHQLISAPMRILGGDPDLVAAIVRYVEVRALLGGTTTSQGVALAKSPGIIGHFRGLVRNVESTGDKLLPPAATHIADIEATDADHFLARLSGKQKLILHLSEGTDPHAHDAFKALHLPDGRWAITENLVGIHCAALTRSDFDVFAAHGGSMVWSPLSNLLLYGQTADIAAALAAKVPIALGSDWAPSGSKNLLGELKVARLAAVAAGVTLSGHDLLAMATTTPATMLGWNAHLGTLEKDKLADILVLPGISGDPYDNLLTATEADLQLVMINGTARVATPALMTALAPGVTTESLTVAGRHRVLNFAQASADPSVEAVSVAEAISRLKAALAALGDPSPHAAELRTLERVNLTAARSFVEGRALLAASQVVDNRMSPRPHLPLRGRLTGPNLADLMPSGLHGTLRPVGRGDRVALRAAQRRTAIANDATHRDLAAATSLPTPALDLDPLTAVDNRGFYTDLAANTNLPPAIRDGIKALAPR